MPPTGDFLLLKALIMGVVEGLTEFLPVSSTGHLILAGDLLGLNQPTSQVFEVVIQSGAMLAVLWEYRARFLDLLTAGLADGRLTRFMFNLAVAFLPAAILGAAFGRAITANLFRPVPVAVAFIVGGVVILWAERRTTTPSVDSIEAVTWRHALKIGFAQCLALVPGTSRAGATIVGGLLFGLSRKVATEFSFFLAVPTLLAAGVYQLYRGRAVLSAADAGWFGVGFVAAFASAFLSIRWLIRYVSTHDYTPFAWYRVVFGLVVLATAYSGLVTWTAR
jgi:undecaprenyl-diphosphatase